MIYDKYIWLNKKKTKSIEFRSNINQRKNFGMYYFFPILCGGYSAYVEKFAYIQFRFLCFEIILTYYWDCDKVNYFQESTIKVKRIRRK